jgi:hypothetical protein
MKKHVTTEEYPEDLPQDLSYLAAAFETLTGIDPMLLDETEQTRLKRVKNRIFSAMEFICSELPKLPRKEKE